MNELKKLDKEVFKLKFTGGDIFWIELTKGIKILSPELREFLFKEGFRLYEKEVVKITKNIVRKVTSEEVFRHALDYVEGFKDNVLEEAFLKQGEQILIKNKAVLLGLSSPERDFLMDSENKSFHIYRNGVVKVEKEQLIKIIPYDDFDSLIWEDRIIDRDFILFEDNEESIQSAMFYKFLENITNNDRHCQSLFTAVGYLLHRYKDQRKPICIIINDENLADDGKPEGGTGKGLIVKAISFIVKKAMYNGKNANFSDNRFAFQNVNFNTDIILIDDAVRKFHFEDLFSVLSDDLPVEKKGKGMVVIPYEKSPKFAITTNYTIKGNSSSHLRRRFDVFLNNNYHFSHTPADDFGCEFFHGWDTDEWARFDYFMMTCLRYYLSFGLIVYDSVELKEKMLKNETSADFWELMNDEFHEFNTRYYKHNLRDKLISNYGGKYDFLNRNHRTVKDWVDQYGAHMKFKVAQGRDAIGTWFEFQSDERPKMKENVDSIMI